MAVTTRHRLQILSIIAFILSILFLSGGRILQERGISYYYILYVVGIGTLIATILFFTALWQAKRNQQSTPEKKGPTPGMTRILGTINVCLSFAFLITMFREQEYWMGGLFAIFLFNGIHFWSIYERLKR